MVAKELITFKVRYKTHVSIKTRNQAENRTKLLESKTRIRCKLMPASISKNVLLYQNRENMA